MSHQLLNSPIWPLLYFHTVYKHLNLWILDSKTIFICWHLINELERKNSYRSSFKFLIYPQNCWGLKRWLCNESEQSSFQNLIDNEVESWPRNIEVIYKHAFEPRNIFFFDSLENFIDCSEGRVWFFNLSDKCFNLIF